jgi:hypothetical protein
VHNSNQPPQKRLQIVPVGQTLSPHQFDMNGCCHIHFRPNLHRFNDNKALPHWKLCLCNFAYSLSHLFWFRHDGFDTTWLIAVLALTCLYWLDSAHLESILFERGFPLSVRRLLLASVSVVVREEQLRQVMRMSVKAYMSEIQLALLSRNISRAWFGFWKKKLTDCDRLSWLSRMDY